MTAVAAQLVAQPAAETRPWSLAHRFLFRVVCCYWVLYALPESGRISILFNIPGARFATQAYIKMWHSFIPWVAVYFFHVSGRPATYFPTGSGDTTLGYISNLLYILISLAAALVWSVLDRRRPDYRKLHGWLRLLVRYTLAFTLFGYGFAKVFPLQFRTPNFARLIEPYGEFSPMGSLWWFMGASIPYIIFSGSAEVLGGLLVLFRRTTTLGAMVSFAVMANVVALNYCYDVPVKLYSTNILLMTVFLAAPDLRRLFDVLVRNRAAQPAELIGPRFEHRWARIASTVFCVLFAGYALTNQLIGDWRSYQRTMVHPTHPPLYGLYDAESGAPPKWRKVAVDNANGFTVRMNDDATQFFATEYDAPNSMLVVAKKDKLVWSNPDAEHILLTGTLNSSPVAIKLRKIDTSRFLLLSRGFHWINETALNR